jgi:glycosyltransferase involved in cell wall biosynthesis
MEVSVIIPVYNAERFIEKAIDSVLSLNETVEVILVEDKSPDNSLAVCEKLVEKYDKVKLFRHPDGENHGPAASRNLGIKNASFEYVSFLDADDFYLPNRFKQTAKIFEENQDADGVYEAIGTYAYDETGKSLHYQRMKEAQVDNLDPNLTTLTKEVLPERLFEVLYSGKHGWFHFNGLTVKKQSLLKSGLLLEELTRFGEDVEFFLRLAYRCRLYPGPLNNPVAMRGVYANNMTANYKEEGYYYKVLVGVRFVSKWVFNIMLNDNFDKRFNRFVTNRYLDNYTYSIQKNTSFFLRKIQKAYYLILILLVNPRLIFKIL